MNILSGSGYTHEMIDHLFMMCSRNKISYCFYFINIIFCL